MAPSALLNLTHGQRKNGSPTALEQSQTQSQSQRNQSGQYPGATGKQPSFNPGQGQYGLYQRNAGPSNSGFQDNRGGQYNAWDRSRNGQQNYVQNGRQQYQQNNRQPETPDAGVFNGAQPGDKPPKFVTPKVAQSKSGRRPSQGDSPAKHASAGGNPEFADMWKQLQSSLPAQETSTQDTSLAHAASVLPRVPSPNKNQSAESTGTKIDVQALFNQAYNSAETQKPAKEESEVNTKKSKPVSRVVSNDEFAAMFKSLEEVHIAEEENREKEKEEDSAAVIKKMLNIDPSTEDSSSTEPSTPSTGDSSKSYGRQVSIQELFEGAKKQQEAPSENSQQQQPYPQQQQQQQQQPVKAKVQGQVRHQKGQGYNQSQGQFQGYQQQQQYNKGGNTNQNNRPVLMIPPSKGGNRNPVMELMTFCQSLQLGLPKYDYHTKGGLHYCEVSLNGLRFCGSQCHSKEEAAESAASIALIQMKGGLPQMAPHPMMQMPPGFPARMNFRPQAGQFSSPNSAFSPVNTLTGYFPGQQSQPPRGYYQGYQQRPFYTQGQGQMYQQANRGNVRQQGNQHQYQQQQLPKQAPPPPQQNRNSNPPNQIPEAVSEEKPLVNVAASQKLTKDGKTQPTCVVTPFVPLQVTRKQTPQKNRKESVSDEGSVKVEETLPREENQTTCEPTKSDSAKCDSVIVEQNKPSVGAADIRHVQESQSDIPETSDNSRETTPAKQKTTQSEPSSGKKPRRRIAANLNFS